MIQAVGIKKNYGDLEVLKGIDIKVEKGQIVAIVGDSGAGKSTLLHILGTLDKPDAGSLTYITDNEVEVRKLGDSALARFRNKNIGFVFQFHNLLPEFTALENVCMPAWIGGANRTEAEAKAKELLVYLNLGARIGHKPTQLSGGEQQRVAVARSLMNDPMVIFADEPSGNLDSKNAEELHDLFFKLREDKNQTFVIVTHNLSLAQRADVTYSIRDGRIVNN